MIRQMSLENLLWGGATDSWRASRAGICSLAVDRRQAHGQEEWSAWSELEYFLSAITASDCSDGFVRCAHHRIDLLYAFVIVRLARRESMMMSRQTRRRNRLRSRLPSIPWNEHDAT